MIVMMSPRSPVLASVAGSLALLVALPACADGSSASSATGERPSVVAAFYPLQFVTDQIGGDKVRVVNLTEPGVEPHDLELTPRQVGKIADADLVLYIKGFQPAVDEAVEQNPAKTTIEASTVATFEETGAEAALESEEGEEGTVETVEKEHAGEERSDPHIWLDPTKLAKIATAVGDRLAAVDSDGAELYRANAAKLAGGLAALDGEYRAGLASCSRKAFVTSHAAFGYLAKRYGLEQIPIAGISPEAEPSPQRIAAVQKLVRDKGITTVFFETLVSPKLAETIARDTGARAEVLDPVEGIEAGSASNYFTVMRANLEALRKALGCR
jgi:zinc transport system substrate-binding protein